MLWDPYQLTSQTQIHGRDTIHEIFLLPSPYFLTRSYCHFSLWNSKESKIEKHLEVEDFRDYCFYPPHSILFFYENISKVYDLYSLKEVKSFSLSVYNAFIDQDKLFFCGDQFVQIFNLKQEKLITQWKVEFNVTRLFTLSNDNLVTLLGRNHIEIWDTQTQEIKFQLRMRSILLPMTVLEISPDHLFFISEKDTTPTMEIWDLNKKQSIFRQNCTLYNAWAMKITSEYFIVRSFDSELWVYEITNCELITILKFQKSISCIANARDLNQLVIGFEDGTMEFWGGA